MGSSVAGTKVTTHRKRTLELVDRAEAPAQVDPGRPRVFALSDPGCVRDNNEDQYLVAQLERAMVVGQSGLPVEDGARIVDPRTARLLMVADGMGGHAAGEVASAVVVDGMVNYAFAMMPWWGPTTSANEKVLAAALREAVQRSQERIRQVAERKGLRRDLGTTLTMAYVTWPMLYLVHVGDSRAYVLRDKRLFQLTRDHNLAQELVASGTMSAEDARTSSFSSVLTNALGGERDTVDVELHRLQLQEGDLLLLCTDGLYGEVGNKDIKARLLRVETDEMVEPCVRNLIDTAKKAGGKDNITAVLARF